MYVKILNSIFIFSVFFCSTFQANCTKQWLVSQEYNRHLYRLVDSVIRLRVPSAQLDSGSWVNENMQNVFAQNNAGVIFSKCGAGVAPAVAFECFLAAEMQYNKEYERIVGDFVAFLQQIYRDFESNQVALVSTIRGLNFMWLLDKLAIVGRNLESLSRKSYYYSLATLQSRHFVKRFVLEAMHTRKLLEGRRKITLAAIYDKMKVFISRLVHAQFVVTKYNTQFVVGNEEFMNHLLNAVFKKIFNANVVYCMDSAEQLSIGSEIWLCEKKAFIMQQALCVAIEDTFKEMRIKFNDELEQLLAASSQLLLLVPQGCFEPAFIQVAVQPNQAVFSSSQVAGQARPVAVHALSTQPQTPNPANSGVAKYTMLCLNCS